MNDDKSRYDHLFTFIVDSVVYYLDDEDDSFPKDLVREIFNSLLQQIKNEKLPLKDVFLDNYDDGTFETTREWTDDEYKKIIFNSVRHMKKLIEENKKKPAVYPFCNVMKDVIVYANMFAVPLKEIGLEGYDPEKEALIL